MTRSTATDFGAEFGHCGGDSPAEVLVAFRDALALERQPSGTLRDLYQGWTGTVQALQAATITGCIRLPRTAAAASDSESALQEYRYLSWRIANVYSAASMEKHMVRRAELNMELVRLRVGRDGARATL